MQCPHCSAPLRLVEPVPASLLDAHVRLVCPVKSCGRDIVAVVRWADAFELSLLTTAAARRQAWRHVARAQKADFAIGVVAVVGTVALTPFLAIWQYLSPSPTDHIAEALVVCVGGLVAAVIFAGGFAIDLRLGAQEWLRTLPRPLLNLMPSPQTYR